MDYKKIFKDTEKRLKLIYKLSFLPDKFYLKFVFRIKTGRKLNLKNPTGFNEKQNWLKLYDKHPEHTPLVDKIAVRDHITKELGEGYLFPLLGYWESYDDIDFSKLPDKFVLKCNHGCAYNIVVTDKSTIDKKAIIAQLNTWLKEDFGAFNIELHYSAIRHHRIICEEFLGEMITDYKFFCFNGIPYCIYVSKDLIHDRQAQIGFFFLDGTKMPLHRDDYQDISSIELPAFFDEMKAAAQKLCEEFPFVRVDFFLANDTWYFAELTFTPGAGMMPFNPEKYDLEWGKMLDISRLK